MRSEGPRNALCIEVHDVAPATWPLCARILERLDALGPVPVTLLVVPDYHHLGRITHHASFLRAIDRRLARGDEVCLHGLHHLDEGPVSRTPAEWFRRRVRTLSEGEFSATDSAITAQRVARGLAEFVSAGWRVQGFVPPAWLLGRDAALALRRFAFSYVALRNAFYRVPEWRPINTTTLSYAAFSSWRRALSRPALDCLFRRAPAERPMRFAVHPVDARHDRVLAHWQSLVSRALHSRTAMTAARIVATHRDRGGGAEDPLSTTRRARAGVASRP